MCETDNPGLRDGTKRGNDNTAGGEQELCAVSRASISREMFSKLGERSHRWQWRFLPFSRVLRTRVHVLKVGVQRSRR